MGSGTSKPASSGETETSSEAPAGRKRYKTFAELVNHSDCMEIYTKGKELGSGNMATVYEYTHKTTGKAYAAKVVLKRTLDKVTDFTNELEILGHLKGHPHILELEDVFEDEKSYHLITDLVSGGELFDRICDAGTYTEQTAKDMILPMLNAIHFCHQNDIVHRDIKPENLLLLDSSPDSPLKIADFGVATWENSLIAENYPKCGTPEYMAPEMFKGGKYDLKVDVWAMGCCVFIMLCGWHPFQDTQDLRAQQQAIITGDLSDLEQEPISNLAKDFIRRMLTVDPERRWSLKELMSHDWIRDSTAGNTNLRVQQQKIKKYQANRRFRKVAFAVMAVNRAKLFGLSRKKKRKEQETSAVEVML